MSARSRAVATTSADRWPDGRRASFTVLAVALVARLVHLFEWSRLPLFDRPTVDAALYLDAARHWAHGVFPAVFFKPPLYSPCGG